MKIMKRPTRPIFNCANLKISQRVALILAEATLTTFVGIWHGGAGIVLTYGLAIAHIYLEKK